MTSFVLAECTISQASLSPFVNVLQLLSAALVPCDQYRLREANQSLGQSNLSEHLISLDPPGTASIEQDMCLLLSIIVVIGDIGSRLEGLVVYDEIL